MEKNKKRISIIDLIFLILLVLVVVFGAYKLSDIKNIIKTPQASKVLYVVEVQNENPEIMNYIKPEDKVFEDESLKRLGTVVEVTKRPYILQTEDRVNKRILLKEVPDKVTVDIKILTDSDKVNESFSVDSVNLLVGKTIDLNVGNAYVKGVITNVWEAQ